MTSYLASVKDVVKHFDGLHALRSVSMDIETGKIVALIGPNGAGKTTFFNIVCGLENADAGSIYFNNTDISIEGYTLGFPEGFVNAIKELSAIR